MLGIVVRLGTIQKLFKESPPVNVGFKDMSSGNLGFKDIKTEVQGEEICLKPTFTTINILKTRGLREEIA